jgi:hypothetical protein
MKQCHACGMPLTKAEDFCRGDESSNFCCYCTNEDGSVKSCEEVFAGGAAYFMSVTDVDQETAEKITRKNMNGLPYWQNEDHSCLRGAMASDEEFAAFMQRLSA